ncbi:MAG: HEPN domain-containing protein [Actinomycetia bacterium]|nr:HEPN domain-containing protein [Actinomycetes bacterium]
MNAPRDTRDEAARWLAYAEEDLATARMIMDADGPLRQACTLAQQAAEKALKAALVIDNQDPPRSHNLGRILRLLSDDWSVKRLGLHLGVLSEWAVASRYPGDWEEPTRQEADEALEAAGRVLQSILDEFQDR